MIRAKADDVPAPALVRFEEALLTYLRRRMPSGAWSLERVIAWDGWRVQYCGPSATVYTAVTNVGDHLERESIAKCAEWASAGVIQEIKELYDVATGKGLKKC